MCGRIWDNLFFHGRAALDQLGQGLAMDSDIRHLLHPSARLGIECFQAADLQTIEEVLLDISDRVLDPPFGENCALRSWESPGVGGRIKTSQWGSNQNQPLFSFKPVGDVLARG
jgi:hypothetical protein